MTAINIRKWLGEKVIAGIIDQHPEFAMFDDLENVALFPTRFLKILRDDGYNIEHIKKMIN